MIKLFYVLASLACVANGKVFRSLAHLRRDQNNSDHQNLQNRSKKLLLFWAVGTSEEAQDLVQLNVHAARQTVGQFGEVYVFLAHYKGGPEDWNSNWYKKEVVGSISQKGHKLALLQAAIQSGKLDLKHYDYLWSLDEDIDLTNTNVGLALQLAAESGAFIMGPAITQERRGLDWPIQAPDPHCRYRYTNFVETMAPLYRADGLAVLFSDCDHCFHKESDWGVAEVWCNLLADRMPADGRGGGDAAPSRETSCAILDACPVLHEDWMTLSTKYQGAQQEAQNYVDVSKWAYGDVLAHNRDFFIAGARAFKCAMWPIYEAALHHRSI